MQRAITKASLRDEHLAIGRRLREIRMRMGISVAEFARRCGIPRETLVAYEHDRLRVPVSLVLAVWRVFMINPDFLATGEGVPHLPCPEGMVPPSVDGSLRFSEVYPKLAPFFDAVERDTVPFYLAAVDSFLAAAREGRTPRGALAVVADAIHRTTRGTEPARIVLTPAADDAPATATPALCPTH